MLFSSMFRGIFFLVFGVALTIVVIFACKCEIYAYKNRILVDAVIKRNDTHVRTHDGHKHVYHIITYEFQYEGSVFICEYETSRNNDKVSEVGSTVRIWTGPPYSSKRNTNWKFLGLTEPSGPKLWPLFIAAALGVLFIGVSIVYFYGIISGRVL